MKKKIFALLLATAISSGMFVGCAPTTPGNEPPVIPPPVIPPETPPAVEYELVKVDGKGVYEINEAFIVNGMKLTLKDKNSTNTKIVNLTIDMIKVAPDMTTEGQKTITVNYEGQEFTFIITVVDSYKKIVNKLLNYLQNYEKGTTESVSVSFDMDLLSKFLKDTATTDKNLTYSLNKEDITNLEGVLPNQQALIEKVYEALTDALVESGLNISKYQILNINSSALQISKDKIFDSIIKNVASKTMEDALFDAMLPGSIDETAEMLSEKFSEMYEVETNTKTIFKRLLTAMKQKSIDTMKVAIGDLLEILQQDADTDSNPQKMAFMTALKSFIEDDSENMIYNLAINCFDALNVKVYDKNGIDITNSYSVIKKYSAFRAQVGLIAKAYDSFLNKKLSVYVLMETTKLAYSEMATIYEYFEEKEYTFIEGLNSHILKYNVQLINFRLNMLENFEKLAIEKTAVLKVEKALFALVGQFVSTNTSLNVETDSESEEEYNEYKEIDESIENIKKLTAYFNAIFAKDREELNKFISELTEDEKYYEYYTKNGESRFLTRLLEKTFVNEEWDNQECNAEFYKITQKLTIFIDGIATKLEKGELEKVDFIDAYAQYALDSLELAEKYPEDFFVDYASVTIVASMHSKFENNAERLQFIIDNIGFNVYEEISIYITEMFGIDNNSVRRVIENIAQKNIELLIDGEDVSNFNMFAEIMDVVIDFKDEELTECFGEEKEIIVNSVKDLATSIDSVIATGNTENLIECFEKNIPEFTKFIQFEGAKKILDFLFQTNFNINEITSGVLNDEQFAPYAKEFLTSFMLGSLNTIGVEIEPTEENYELINENFTEIIYSSMFNEETGKYEWSNLKAEVIIRAFYNTLDAFEIEYNQDIKNIIAECLNSEGNIMENLKNYILDDEKRTVVVDYLANNMIDEDMSQEQIDKIKEFLDSSLLDIINNNISLKQFIERYYDVVKSFNDEDDQLFVDGNKTQAIIIYELLSGNIENAQKVLQEYREIYKDEQMEMYRQIPAEVDFVLHILNLEKDNGISFMEIINEILNDEHMSAGFKDFICKSSIDFFYNIIGLDNGENYDVIMENFAEPLYESMFDEASQKYSWSNLKKDVVINCVYNTLTALDYEYDANLRKLISECLSESGTIEENFKKYIKNTKNREFVAKTIVNLISGTEDFSFREDFEVYFDYILLEMAYDRLTAEYAYEEFIELLKSCAIYEEEHQMVALADFIIQGTYELTQGNLNEVKTLLKKYRKEYPNETNIPKEVDFILDLATYEAESAMDMFAKLLETKDFYDVCLTTLSDLMISITPTLYECDADKYAIIKTYFSESILNEIIETKSLTAETVAKIYFSTLEKLNEEFAAEIAYNEMLADFVTTMLKCSENGTIVENSEINMKEFLYNNKKALASMMSEMLVATVEEEFAQSTKKDAEEIFETLIDTVVAGNYEDSNLVEQITDFCEKYYSEDVCTKLYSASTLIILMSGNKDIDYNKLFGFVELPEGVKVDYNVLINKLMDETNWKECIKISQLEYAINENDAKNTYVGQSYYLTIDINIDAEIASLIGSIKVRVDIK